MRDLRRLVAAVVIVSFSLAALLGIAVLVGAGEFGDTEAQVLLTTVIVGFESVAALCYLALAGHRLALVGVAGGVVSLVATALALWLTWIEGYGDAQVWQAFGVAVTIAASLAQVSLLLALVGRRTSPVLLGGTLLAVTVVAGMVVLPIVTEDVFSSGYWRVFGVVAILDVLGTVVLMALGVFGGRAEQREARPESRLLSAAVEARLVETAHQRGTSPSQLVSDALDAYVVR
ncbi:CopG family transcriptional regulator [Nocardioides sp. SR21]|uniref:ribbon-helix-helix domain-containing protein n=1 Tax=Nocardioides sp. SR21 TaxID=2919501 RepID=UPI001FA9D11D|nr:CopG family transcriptional regulator [Nocardioides sp. SR21]